MADATAAAAAAPALAAGQPSGTEEGMADAAPPVIEAAASAGASAAAADTGLPAAARRVAAAVDTNLPAAAGAAAEAGASAAPHAAGAPAPQRPAPKTRAAQRAEWTEVILQYISFQSAAFPSGRGRSIPAAAVLRPRDSTRICLPHIWLRLTRVMCPAVANVDAICSETNGREVYLTMLHGTQLVHAADQAHQQTLPWLHMRPLHCPHAISSRSHST